MALSGIKVIELGGLAPAPFCGMILADFGASIIRVDKINATTDLDSLGNGKRSVAINLKDKEGTNILRRLCKNSDVLIEPFRKGVMEKLGIGPNIMLEDNKRLVYARLSGFGQKGMYSERAGHDINYIATSGLLSMLGWKKDAKPSPPLNLVADFGGGGMTCALGIIMALFERERSGLGQVVDCSMVEGSAYLGSWIYRSKHLPIWGKDRTENVLDGGASFYDTYETKDGKFMAVGALEPQFYTLLLRGLNLSEEKAPQYSEFNFAKHRDLFASIFKQKTREEWCMIFDKIDACVTPVLTLDEAPYHKHNVESGSFVVGEDEKPIPKPAPNLSRTPGISNAAKHNPQSGEHSVEILMELGYSSHEIELLEENGVIQTNSKSKL